MGTDPLVALPQPALLEQIGRGLKRVRGANEAPDARGFRTIWHHGPMKTDLFSHVGPDRELRHQELVYLGKAVAWDVRGGVSTGKVADEGSPAAPASAPMAYSEGATDRRSMLEAAVLLRAHPQPDYYTAHLRVKLDEALYDLGETGIEGLEPELRAELARAFEHSQEVATLPPPTSEREAVARRRSRAIFVVGGLVVVTVLVLALLSFL